MCNNMSITETIVPQNKYFYLWYFKYKVVVIDFALLIN